MEMGEGSITFQDILEVTAREVKFCTFFDKIFRFPINFPKLLNEKRQNLIVNALCPNALRTTKSLNLGKPFEIELRQLLFGGVG